MKLHSISSNPLYIPRVKTKARTRAFSLAAPTVWNSVSVSVTLGDMDSDYRGVAEVTWIVII